MGRSHSREMILKLLSAIPFAFVLSISTAAQADGFDFKGLAFGSSVATVKEKYPDHFCSSPNEGVRTHSDVTCLLSTERTYAGASARIFLGFYDDKLGHVHATLAPSDFAIVTTALRDKYGKPSSIKTEQLTNRMGVVFENQILEWKNSGTAIRARKYTSSLNESSVEIFSDSYDAELKKRLDAKRAQGAKDL